MGVLSDVIEGIGEVVLEGNYYEKVQKDLLRYVVERNGDGDDEPAATPRCSFGAGSGGLCEQVLGEVVVEGSVVQKGNGGLVCGTGRRRITELDLDPVVVIVSDVGVGDGLIDVSRAGGDLATGSRATGAAAEHVSSKRGAQNCTDLGKSIMRETTKAQDKEADMQAHRRRDRCHVGVQEPTNAGNISENWPFFLDQFSSQEKGKFVVSDLVWGKVISHPWWPGQIIDPSDASAHAIKCQKKDALLVAYFWDKTFAWCDESQLKPFFSNFSALEAQTDWDMFSNAVKSALKEVCRRIDAGTLCSCLNDKSLFKNYPKMENAGVREGFEYYTVDKSKVINSLNPRGLVGSIRDLALDTSKGTDNKLSLVMSKYYIKSFRRWIAIMLQKQTKPILVPTEGLNVPKITASLSDASIPETPVMQITPSQDHTAPVVNSDTEKPKKKRGRPRKTPTTPIDTASIEASSDLSSKTNTGPDKALNGKRHKAQTPPDKRVSSSSNIKDSSYWSGISLHTQADAKLDVPAAKRPVIIPVADKKSDECIPTALMLSFSNRYSKVPSDMEILRTFSKYGPLKGEMEKEVEGTESRFKLVFKRLADAEMAFGSLRKHNVFWPSLLSYRLAALPSSEVANSSEPEMVEVNGEDHGHLRRTELPGELNPTTLLLIFSTKSGKIPSEMELIRMFSYHGPLKDGPVQKEVEGIMCQFRITFKKHSSAQMAFTSLRKQNVFGPSLLSYRLINFPLMASKLALKENLVQLSNAIVDNRTEKPVHTAVGLASNVQNDSVTDISVDPSSIAHRGSSGGVVAPSSTGQGMNVDEISIVPLTTVSDCDTVDPQRKRQDDYAFETSITPSSCVQGADVTEMSINLRSSVPATELLVGSSHTIKACEILPNPFPSRMQAESLSEIPIDLLSAEGKSVGEVLKVCSKIPGVIGGNGKTPTDSLNTGEGKAIGEVPIVRLQAEDGEVGDRGEMPSSSSSTREEDTLFEMQIDPLGTGQDQEPRPKNLDDSKAEKQAVALENSGPAKTKSISNGDVLLECTPSLPVTSGCNTTTQFQKTSPIWQPLESLELFTRTAQRPHFKKLARYCQEMRDGMAIGLMVTYANLIDSIKKLSIDDDVTTIEQKFSCLDTLEENGFNVDLLRTRLNQILQIKTDNVKSRLKLAELEKELTEKESESINTQRLMERNRSDMVKLEEQINALTEQSRTLVAEKDRLLELTVGNGHEISRLKNELSIVNRFLEPARKEFAQVLAQPF